jgi:4'-phosphopantetheinyl transferase EntD
MASISALAFQQRLPSFIAVSSGPLLDAVPPLSHDEQASIAPMAQGRLSEFAQGRQHARQALEQFGVKGASIPMSADRSPVWPQGFAGSISHVPANVQRGQQGWVIAAVARSKHCAGLGIDLERTDMLMPEHWSHYMTGQELTWIARQPVSNRSDLAHGLWSAKEAVMKALCRPLEPHDIGIRLLPDLLSFEAKCRVPKTSTTGDTMRVNGWLAFEHGWVLALATRQAPSGTPRVAPFKDLDSAANLPSLMQAIA